MNMPKSLHLKIESSLVTGEYRFFQEAAKTWTTEMKNQRIPVRIVLGAGFGKSIRNRLIQPSLELKDAQGQAYTLRSSLETTFPSLDLDFVRVVIQGICPPLDSSLLYLSDNLCHADQFLYVCLSLHETRQRKKRQEEAVMKESKEETKNDAGE